MRFIYVDDEKNAITNFEFYVKGRDIVKSLRCFMSPQEAILYAKTTPFDVAFLDIEMPNMTGFELAQILKQYQPDIEIIYVTAFDNYHQEAYQTGGRAYLMKPYDENDVEEIFSFLRKMEPPAPPEPEKPEPEKPVVKQDVFVQTFGNFDLWVNGTPVVFRNAKLKELLAVLIDRRGSVIRSVEIFDFLWPDKIYSKTTATYVRKVVQALKLQLAECGCPEIVTFSRNAFYVNQDAFVCDYYTLNAGETKYIATYNGYYMTQYPWAEESIYIIEQKIKELNANR